MADLSPAISLVPEPLISKTELKERIDGMAKEIVAAMPECFYLVALLNGAFMFCADLARALSREGASPEVCFWGLSSYEDGRKSKGKVRETMALSCDVRGKTVLIIDDIHDSGKTLEYACHALQEKGAERVEVAVLLQKPRVAPAVSPLSVGFHIEDHFVVGYGLDEAGRYRELPYIARL